jgi:riboflavin synthase
MFTGIVSALGKIKSMSGDTVRRFVITSDYDVEGIELGASIAHSGACLTVIDKGSNQNENWFCVEVSPETLRLTTLGDLSVGAVINLERALCVGEELGGHIVTGHVDGVGEIIERRDENEWIVLRVSPPVELNKYIARKGSVTVDGVSLTVNAVTQSSFDLMIIPHTAEVTTLGQLQKGARVNLEIDLMARYAARLSQFSEVPA